MRNAAALLRVALALLHNEWRIARATIIAGILFSGVFVAACDLMFTKDDPTFLAYTAMPAITVLVVAAIAADLFSRDVDSQCTTSATVLPVSLLFVFLVRLAFLAAVGVVVACGVSALGNGWVAWFRGNAPSVDILAAKYRPLAWAAIVPASACVVLASACGARGMAALVAGLGPFAGIVLALHRVKLSVFDLAIETRGVVWLDAAATVLLLFVAERVHATGAHRAASAGRRCAWAGLLLAAFVAPAGIVSAAALHHHLRCEPGDATKLEMLSLAPDERHVAVVATRDSRMHRKTWIIDLRDGSVVVLPEFAAFSRLGVEWLEDGRVRVPFVRLSYDDWMFEARLGTFDGATGELLSDQAFDERNAMPCGFELDQSGPKFAARGFGRLFPLRDFRCGARYGECAARLDGGSVGLFDLTKSPEPYAIVDDVGAADFCVLSSGKRLMIVNKGETRIVSARDGHEVASLAHSSTSFLRMAEGGSSSRFLWRIELPDGADQWQYSLVDLDTGATRLIGDDRTLQAPYVDLRVLDDGSVISVTSDEMLHYRAPDGTETVLPLRLK